MDTTCATCGKQLSNRSHYLRHLREVHGENGGAPVKVFNCSFIGCTATYNAAHNLKIHIKRDHEQQKVECDLCGRQYNTPSNLQTHKRTVHGETGARQPKKCSFPGCDYTTPYSHSILQRHYQRNHGVKGESDDDQKADDCVAN